MSRNFSTLGEGNDLVELARDLGAAHAEDGAVEIDVLAAGELGMEAGADLQQARHAAADFDAALGRRGDAGKDLEQRRFAGAVAADDADDLAPLDLEGDVLQRPEPLLRRQRPDGGTQATEGRGTGVGDRFAEGPVASSRARR